MKLLKDEESNIGQENKSLWSSIYIVYNLKKVLYGINKYYSPSGNRLSSNGLVLLIETETEHNDKSWLLKVNTVSWEN